MTTTQSGESASDIVSLFVRCNSWRYVESGGKLKYCITENFCFQTSTDANWVALYQDLTVAL